MLSPIEDTFERYVDEIMMKHWASQDFRNVEIFFTPDAVIDGLVPGESLNIAGYCDAVKQIMIAVHLNGYEVINIFSDGRSHCAAQLKLDLTFRSTERSGNLNVVLLTEMECRRIHKAHLSMNMMELFENLGLLPAGTFFLGLSGATLN